MDTERGSGIFSRWEIQNEEEPGALQQVKVRRQHTEEGLIRRPASLSRLQTVCLQADPGVKGRVCFCE